MKKFPIISGILFLLLAIGGLALMSGCSQRLQEKASLYWVPEKSFFVDYEITDKNTVRFRYSICFVNAGDEDVDISISAKFEKKETRGWLKQDLFGTFFDGLDESGEWSYRKIKHGEEVNIIFTFEGEYLGGDVNEKLSFPEELMVALQYE